MTKPFSPHLFNSLGKSVFDSGLSTPWITRTDFSSNVSDKALQRGENRVLTCYSNYSIPTRALIYCNRS
jgi:hypothetical protein